MKSAILLLALLPGLLWGQSSIGRGQADKLYQQHCAVCHGEKGRGGLGGPLVSGEWQHAATDEARARVIRDGLDGLNMQGFGDTLTEEQIRSLVIFMRELKLMADRVEPPPEREGVVETQKLSYRVEEIAKNQNNMWGVTFLPDGRYLVTEIDGPVRVVEKDGSLNPPVENTPEVVRFGQGGMLDVNLHPDYETNGWVYLVFSHGEGRDAMTSLVRGRIRDNRWTDEDVLFRADEADWRRAGQHFGSRIAFHDGYVFFSIGDRGAKNQAQDLNKPNGKIHRLHDDGRIPGDNPFVGKSKYPSIWSYGHRNPQALAFKPGTGELWSTEHGPRGGDELNRIQKGANYGWPKVTHGMNYGGSPITEHTSLPGMESPVWHWTPSIATCGMAFADGGVYPEWAGDILAGGLVTQVLERLKVNKDHNGLEEREVALKGRGRVRDVKTGPDGRLYLILEGGGSRLIRLSPEKK